MKPDSVEPGQLWLWHYFGRYIEEGPKLRLIVEVDHERGAIFFSDRDRLGRREFEWEWNMLNRSSYRLVCDVPA